MGSDIKRLQRKVRHIRDNLGDEVEDAVQKGVQRTAVQMRNEIATNGTFWTGNLVRNTYATTGVTVGNTTRYKIVADVPYAAFVEFGTGPRGDPTAPFKFQFGAPPFTPGLVGSIMEWVMTRPVFFGPRTSGVAWGIAESISEKGTRPYPFFRPVWFRMKPAIERDVGFAARKVIRRA